MDMDDIHGLSTSSTKLISELFAQRLLQYALLMCNYWYITNSYVFEVLITEEKANLVFQCIFGYYQEKLDVTDSIGYVKS